MDLSIQPSSNQPPKFIAMSISSEEQKNAACIGFYDRERFLCSFQFTALEEILESNEMFQNSELRSTFVSVIGYKVN